MRSLKHSCLSLFGLLVCATATVWSQPPGNNPSATPAAPKEAPPLPIANPGDQVVAKHEALNLIDAEKYRVNLSLEPHQQVLLSAPHDAIVRQVLEKTNNKVKPQTEILRLESTAQKLGLQKAQAEYRAATLEQKLAKDEDQKALAAARLEAAKAGVDLAQFLYDQTGIRTPINGEVRKILVVEGQYVRAGDPLALIGDSSKMKIEIPVERAGLEKGSKRLVKIEANEMEGTVEAIVPLNPGFDPLRDLFESITSAVVVFDNTDGRLFAGQTVYVPIIPRQPIVQVASSAVLNAADGGRRVQVLRQGVVRDIGITLMGPVGVDRLYVSGAFAPNDEIIFQTSHQLPDGFQLEPIASAIAKPGTTPAGTRPMPTEAKPGVNF
ncbi:HlyD family efflux transporter periplasmic adaptor subunit [bacterium]|nr:HlyD family efflux transporter periplasmic adaptor subunit [bacterium]